MEAQAGRPDAAHPSPSASPFLPPAPRPAIVVCHSLPTNWKLPEPGGDEPDQCPPQASKHAYVYVVGRTMFETDKWVLQGRLSGNALRAITRAVDIVKDGQMRAVLRGWPNGVCICFNVFQGDLPDSQRLCGGAP